jgi:hypothetical protein
MGRNRWREARRRDLRKRGITSRIARRGIESLAKLGKHRWVAEKLNSEDHERARQLWAEKGKEAFAAERSAGVDDRTQPQQDQA